MADKGNTYLETVLGKIKNKFSELLKRANRQSMTRALDLYRALAGLLANLSSSKSATPQNVSDALADDEPIFQGRRPSKEIGTGTELFKQNQDRLLGGGGKGGFGPKHIGRMIMFFYDPIYAEELPYFDRFPMVIPIKFYNDGFLGLNLHYLPHRERAMLLDILYNIFFKNNQMDEKRILQITYEALRDRSRTRLYLPCIKRYKYQQLRSKILLVKPDHWEIVLYLPLERFEKRSLRHVHQESLNLIRGRR